MITMMTIEMLSHLFRSVSGNLDDKLSSFPLSRVVVMSENHFLLIRKSTKSLLGN